MTKRENFKDLFYQNVWKYTLPSQNMEPSLFLNLLGETLLQEMGPQWSKDENLLRNRKKVSYFSIEYLLGRSLKMNLSNRELNEELKDLASNFNINIDEIFEEEKDPGLGNGGLGRLASCFLDSMAALDIPSRGYGLYYQFGLFKQVFKDKRQVEEPDNWTSSGNIWGIEKRQNEYMIPFEGSVEILPKENNQFDFNYTPQYTVIARAIDYPISSPQGGSIKTLRLWKAFDSTGLNLEEFNQGHYEKALAGETEANAISGVLYPNDQSEEGKKLRLKQQYLFVSASIQDLLIEFKEGCSPQKPNWDNFFNYNVIQLNDTHPILAIPELMRLLMDQEQLSWNRAWRITKNTFAYTNHTVLSEALEKWPEQYIKELFPRLYMIIEEIERRECSKEGSPRIIQNGTIEMASLALYSTFSVNGVAKLHSQILKDSVLHPWYKLFPQKFTNKTNGITHRRWLIQCNPRLNDFLIKKIGNSWHKDPENLKKLLEYQEDKKTLKELEEIKFLNKVDFTKWLQSNYSISINPNSLFDFQIKRIHEYKRQLLNILSIIDRYLFLKRNPGVQQSPKTFFMAGKAAPGYYIAKEIIHLALAVSKVINKDSETNQSLKFFFIPDYKVSVAERIFPAADISQQISTAGKEASGTGNMKFMMNGALTLGTRDGANIEIFEHCGEENGFPFGLSSYEIKDLKLGENYHPRAIIESSKELQNIIKALEDEVFGPITEFKPLLNYLYYEDNYFVLADFLSYKRALADSDALYLNKEEWAKKSLINIAQSGYFSSDRTIKEYASEIWRL